MKLSKFWKGLIMAIVGFIATVISDLESFNLGYVVIATGGFTILYMVKNAIWPTTSPAWMINLWDGTISGILIAVSMAISSFAASIITTGVIDWHALWIAVVGAVIGYFAKTIPQDGTKLRKAA